jgi:hypothetical protein
MLLPPPVTRTEFPSSATSPPLLPLFALVSIDSIVTFPAWLVIWTFPDRLPGAVESVIVLIAPDVTSAAAASITLPPLPPGVRVLILPVVMLPLLLVKITLPELLAGVLESFVVRISCTLISPVVAVRLRVPVKPPSAVVAACRMPAVILAPEIVKSRVPKLNVPPGAIKKLPAPLLSESAMKDTEPPGALKNREIPGSTVILFVASKIMLPFRACSVLKSIVTSPGKSAAKMSGKAKSTPGELGKLAMRIFSGSSSSVPALPKLALTSAKPVNARVCRPDTSTKPPLEGTALGAAAVRVVPRASIAPSN